LTFNHIFYSTLGFDEEFYSAQHAFDKLNKVTADPNWLLKYMAGKVPEMNNEDNQLKTTAQPEKLPEMRNSDFPPVNKPTYSDPSSFLNSPIQHSPPGMDESDEDEAFPPVNKPTYSDPSSFVNFPISHSPPGMDESDEDEVFPPVNKPSYSDPSSFLNSPISHSPPGMDSEEEPIEADEGQKTSLYSSEGKDEDDEDYSHIGSRNGKKYA